VSDQGIQSTAGLTDVYAVGVLADLRQFRDNRLALPLGRRLKTLRYSFFRLGTLTRRSAWNGFLAEPRDMTGLRRCGHGWTRHRALRDLERHIHECHVSAGGTRTDQ